MRSLALYLCLGAGLAQAGEFALLANGARLHADRHETENGKVRLFNGAGYIELDASQVRGFDAEEARPIAPAAPAVVAPDPPVQAAKLELSIPEMGDAAADKYGLPRPLVRSVMAAESAFQPGVVSPKGAIGPMQLMPGTAKDLGVDPYDPIQNIDAGARYLKSLLERYDYKLWRSLAAYNAGPGAVDKYHGVPPYRETIRYVRKIAKDLENTGAIQP